MKLWLCRNNKAKPDYKAVPSVVFSSPQLAFVGKHEQAAVDQHQDVDIYTSTSTCACFVLPDLMFPC